MIVNRDDQVLDQETDRQHPLATPPTLHTDKEGLINVIHVPHTLIHLHHPPRRTLPLHLRHPTHTK